MRTTEIQHTLFGIEAQRVATSLQVRADEQCE